MPQSNSTIAPAQVLLKADAVTLVAKADKSGHVRLTAAPWDDARVLLPGEVGEIWWEAGQVVVSKRVGPRAEDRTERSPDDPR